MIPKHTHENTDRDREQQPSQEDTQGHQNPLRPEVVVAVKAVGEVGQRGEKPIDKQKLVHNVNMRKKGSAASCGTLQLHLPILIKPSYFGWSATNSLLTLQIYKYFSERQWKNAGRDKA